MTKPRTVAVLGLAVSAGLALAGCGSSGSKNPGLNQAPSTTSAAATSTSAEPSASADPSAQAKSDALTAYKGMIAAVTRELATNEADPDLMTYASGNAYLFFNDALTWQRGHNVVQTGTPQSAPAVTDIKVDGPTPSATVTDCFGGPSYKSVVWKTKGGHKQGDSAEQPGAVLAAHPVTAIMQEKDGHWFVINYTPGDQGSTC